jgi:hypothetical protein
MVMEYSLSWSIAEEEGQYKNKADPQEQGALGMNQQRFHAVRINSLRLSARGREEL